MLRKCLVRLLSGEVFGFFLSQGCARELPFWVSASDTQTQTKPQAPAPNKAIFVFCWDVTVYGNLQLDGD